MDRATDALRVLISAESFLPDVNGVTNSVLRVLDHLDQWGHEVLVIAPGPGDDHVELASQRRIPVERVRGLDVPLYPTLRFGVAASGRIRRLMKSFQPDVVHLAAPVVLGARVGQVAAGLGVPVVALFQTNLSGFATDYGLRVAAPTIWSWLRKVHNQADLTLAPTGTVAADLSRRRFEHVAVWGRGVDQDRFDPARRSAAWRRTVGVDTDEVLVGYVGRLAAEKRVDRLEALLGNRHTRLVIVGDGPERQRLERLLPTATFTGFLSGDDLGSAMASLDIMVHTGEHETYCQAAQEAMAAGVAVVAPGTGGLVDLIEHGRTGLLYRPGENAAMARCVELLVADPALRRRLAAAGRASVSDRSWESMSRQLIDWYRSVVVPEHRVAA